MKKKLISLLVAGIVAFSAAGLVTPVTSVNAAENRVQTAENQEAFAISFSYASYSVNQQLTAAYHGVALVGDSIYLVADNNNKSVGNVSYHYDIKNLTTNENVKLNYYEGSPSVAWKPNAAGLYEVKVSAHDEAGHSAETSIRYSIDNRFTPNEVPNPNNRANQGGDLDVNFERADYYNPTLNFFYKGNAEENDNIYFVANATGGVGKLNYTYRVAKYHGGPNDYVESTSNSPVYNWRPESGSYQVYLTVTDEAGHSKTLSTFYSITSK